MDNNILEKMFCNGQSDKLNTEQCLTSYYKTQGLNIFKSAELAQSNIVNFVEFINKSITDSQTQNIPYIFSFATKEIVIINNNYFKIKKIHSNLLKMDWRDFKHYSYPNVGI